jgi:hypothetical protein
MFETGDNLSDYCLSQRKRSVHTGMTNRVLVDHERFQIRKSFQSNTLNVAVKKNASTPKAFKAVE